MTHRFSVMASSIALALGACAVKQANPEPVAVLEETVDYKYAEIVKSREVLAEQEKVAREAKAAAKADFLEKPILKLGGGEVAAFCELAEEFQKTGMSIEFNQPIVSPGKPPVSKKGEMHVGEKDVYMNFEEGISIQGGPSVTVEEEIRNPIELATKLMENKIRQMLNYVKSADKWRFGYGQGQNQSFVNIPELTLSVGSRRFYKYDVKWSIYQNTGKLDEYYYCEVMTGSSENALVYGLPANMQPNQVMSIICLQQPDHGKGHQWDIVNLLIDDQPEVTFGMKSGDSEWKFSPDKVDKYMVASMVLMGDKGNVSIGINTARLSDGMTNSTARLDLDVLGGPTCLRTSSHNAIDGNSAVRNSVFILKDEFTDTQANHPFPANLQDLQFAGIASVGYPVNIALGGQ